MPRRRVSTDPVQGTLIPRHRTTVLISKDILNRTEHLAVDRDTNVSAIIELALTEYLARHGETSERS